MATDRPTSGGGATGRDRRSTKALILDTAIDLLERRGAERFTVEEVLIESDTSASSLYHHFGSRQGLLVAVEEERYRRGLRAEDRGNLEGGFAATTTEEFFEFVAGQLRRIATDPGIVTVRRERLQVAARALDSPDLASRTASAQARLIDEVAACFAAAKARGLINAHLDSRAYSAWFHGLTLGRAFTEDSLDAEAWLAIAIPAALAPLRPTA